MVNVLPHRLQRPRRIPDPIMVLIVRLFAAAAMTDDGILGANRAMAQDDLHAGLGPIGFKVELRRREGEQQNRSEEGPARPGYLARSTGRREALPPTQISAWKKNNAGCRRYGERPMGWRQKVRRLSPDWPVNPRISALGGLR